MTGEDLRRRIKESGMAFNEVARRMGIPSQSLNSICKTKNVASDKLEKVCEALGWTMGRLYSGQQTVMAIGDSSAAGDYANAANAEALCKALDEVAAQRRIVERLITIIERGENGQKTEK